MLSSKNSGRGTIDSKNAILSAYEKDDLWYVVHDTYDGNWTPVSSSKLLHGSKSESENIMTAKLGESITLQAIDRTKK